MTTYLDKLCRLEKERRTELVSTMSTGNIVSWINLPPATNNTYRSVFGSGEVNISAVYCLSEYPPFELIIFYDLPLERSHLSRERRVNLSECASRDPSLRFPLALRSYRLHVHDVLFQTVRQI